MDPLSPSRTALRVALRRAAHQLVDAEPLVFRDPFATRVLGPAAVAELQRTPGAARKPFSAAMRSWMVARARFAEDVLAEAASTHRTVQYLVLGAGLDTFALRNPYPNVRVFEVDHPATQAWKRGQLASAALTLPPGAVLVAVDFETQSLRQQLLQTGFDFAIPTVTAWLGVVPYLTPEGFAATCRVLGRFAPGSQTIFDYGQPREVLPPVEQLMHDSLAARVAQAGEPFQLFFTPASLAEELEIHGLGVQEDLGSTELNRRYFLGRTDGLGLRGSAGRVCHAEVSWEKSSRHRGKRPVEDAFIPAPNCDNRRRPPAGFTAGEPFSTLKEHRMQYQQALDTLAALGPELRTGKALPAGTERRKFSLDHIRILLAELGDPHRQYPSVLIAGTNGKGSTAATLASVCSAAGLRTGLYTSPHLIRVNERIRVDGVEIADADFGRLFGRVYGCAQKLVEGSRLPHIPSFFELLTAVGFLYFAEQAAGIAVLEVGLGGRLDATNVVEPSVSVITDIGIDHTEFLGNTLGEIAHEKAGILRRDGVLVTLSQHPEANAAIGEAAMALNVRGVDAARCLPPRGFVESFFPPLHSPVSSADPGKTLAPRKRNEEEGPGSGAPPAAAGSGSLSAGVPSEPSPLGSNSYPLSIDGEILTLRSPLAGQHQQRNLALAVATALELRANQGFLIPNAAIETGVAATQWPGRLEWLPPRPDTAQSHAPLLLDVAHNPAGAWTLRAALAQLPEDRPRTLIFSCLADKKIGEMASILFPLFDSRSGDPARRGDHIILAPIPNSRAASVDDLLAAAHALDVPAHAAPHLAGALHQAQTLTPVHGVIVATGSVYLVGALRATALAEVPAAAPHV